MQLVYHTIQQNASKKFMIHKKFTKCSHLERIAAASAAPARLFEPCRRHYQKVHLLIEKMKEVFKEMGIRRKVLALFLSLTLVVSMVPSLAFAAYTPATQSTSDLYLTADGGENTIAITAVDEPEPQEPQEPDPEVPDPIYGDLALRTSYTTLQRDYAQVINVTVSNNTSVAIQYYLEAANPYDDIYLNFVKAGSTDEPLTILAGEEQSVELSIFLQNAMRSNYTIPVSAFKIANGKDSESPESLHNVRFAVNLPNFNAEIVEVPGIQMFKVDVIGGS
jgi:hypothetical protein